jgi:hypothetical protein
MAKRIQLDQCFGLLIDVQEFFLLTLPAGGRGHIERHCEAFLQLLKYLQVPTLCTIEKPVDEKGALSEALTAHVQHVLEKNYFDLTKEKEIATYLRGLGRKQAIVAGGETDVCVLQSCLGLLEMGFEVFVLEDLLFSSSKKTSGAIERLRAEGVVFLTFKSLFHELMLAVEGSEPRGEIMKPFGYLPDALAGFEFS